MLNLDEIADEIARLDSQLNELDAQGKKPGDPEWSRVDDRLTEIGEQLNSDGGEDKMREGLTLAYEKGLSGRYVDRHWNHIGDWMG
jgi:hypothetical protein